MNDPASGSNYQKTDTILIMANFSDSSLIKEVIITIIDMSTGAQVSPPFHFDQYPNTNTYEVEASYVVATNSNNISYRINLEATDVELNTGRKA